MTLNLVLVLILLGGWFSGRLFHRLGLPSVLGMLICGLVIGLGGDQVWPTALIELEPFLKTFALVVILLRAGLGLQRSVLHRIGRTALAMAILPCLLEAGTLILILHVLWEFDWITAALTAFMLSAVSPAVVVPAMLRLSEQGFGKKHEVPTLVLAGASVDDVLAITLFSICLRGSITSDLHWAQAVWELPLAILLGLLPGIVIGLVLVYLFRRHREQVRATEKTLILLMSGLLLVQAGDFLHSAALLGVMAVGFLLLEYAEPIAHELSTKLSKIWVFAEITLFVLIGMKVDPGLALQAGPAAAAMLLAGLLARSTGVWIATAGSELSHQERLFCICAYLPKATVQAALGSVALTHGLEHGDTILALAVLSILLTAPLGLMAIRVGGPRLLDAPLNQGDSP